MPRKLRIRRIIGHSLAATLENWYVIWPVGIVAFFIVPFVLSNVREVVSSTALPGGALFVPAVVPTDRIAGLVLGAGFTVATYVLGALGIGAICVAVWPSIAGHLDRPTLSSVYVDLRPRVGGIVRTALIIGTAVWILRSIAGLASSLIGSDVQTVTDPAEYLRALSGSQITAHVAINFIVTAGVLYLLVRYFLAIPVVVFEGKSGAEALDTSRRLVAGNAWRVLALLVLVGVFQQVGSTLLAFVDLAPTSWQAAPLWEVVDELARLVPALIDLFTLSLLALWMGNAYVQLHDGFEADAVAQPTSEHRVTDQTAMLEVLDRARNPVRPPD